MDRGLFINNLILCLILLALARCGGPSTTSTVTPPPIFPQNPEPGTRPAVLRTDADPGPGAPVGLVPPTAPPGGTAGVPVVSPPTPSENVPRGGAPRWINLATLEVENFSDKTVRIDVGVTGRTDSGNLTCEFIDRHPRIRPNQKWSPLPLVVFSQSDRDENLSPMFTETLDFPDREKETGTQQIGFLVEFTRLNVFRTLARVKTQIIRVENEPSCSAHLDVCLNPVEQDGRYQCTGQWRELRRLVTQVDVIAHLSQGSMPERQRSDVTSLILELKNLDGAGNPTGSPVREVIANFNRPRP